MATKAKAKSTKPASKKRELTDLKRGKNADKVRGGLTTRSAPRI